MFERVREVDILRDQAGDGGLRAGNRADRLRNEILAKREDCMAAGLVVPGSRQRKEERGGGPVAVCGLDHRPVADPAVDR